MKTRKAILILVCTSFFICETGIRLYERVRYAAPWGSYDRERTLWTYGRAGKTGRPHARFRDITLNSLGLRGPELRSGTTRIVCIGASEAFGLYESPGSEFPRQLERLLNRGFSTPPYDVLNWSYAGARLDTFAAGAPDFAARVHPVMALIYPSPAAYIGPPSQYPDADRPPDRTFPQLRSVPYVRALFRAVAPGDVKSLAYRAWSWLQQRGHPPLAAISPDWILRFRSDLQQLVSRLRQAGVEPILLTHATPFGSRLDNNDRALLIDWRRFHPGVSESALLEMEARSNESIRRFARQERVELLDVGEGLRGCHDCFADFAHFTDRGAAEVAVILGASIASRLAAHRADVMGR